MHFEDDRGVAVVFDRHSFAEIVGVWHGIESVRGLNRYSGGATLRRRQAKSNLEGAARSAPKYRDTTTRFPPAYRSFSLVRSCESTIPTGTCSSSTTIRSSMRWR